jgi:hypothetical protein
MAWSISLALGRAEPVKMAPASWSTKLIEWADMSVCPTLLAERQVNSIEQDKNDVAGDSRLG